MLIRKDAIHPPPIEVEEFLLNLVKTKIWKKILSQKINYYAMWQLVKLQAKCEKPTPLGVG